MLKDKFAQLDYKLLPSPPQNTHPIKKEKKKKSHQPSIPILNPLTSLSLSALFYFIYLLLETCNFSPIALYILWKEYRNHRQDLSSPGRIEFHYLYIKLWYFLFTFI